MGWPKLFDCAMQYDQLMLCSIFSLKGRAHSVQLG